MTKTLKHRILACIIDYGIIAGYATLLFLVANLFFSIFVWKPGNNPIIGQLIGFLTLTFPVVTYSYLTEKSSWRGTVGKKLQKLIVLTDQNKSAKNILLRNILKFLPWELAHTGIHWTIYYTSNGIETPLWTWVILILPQVFVLGYFVTILISKGESSIYDKISKTKIVYRTNYPLV
ncbi:MAG: RDD family protein [Saprospiraceae bacterium]|nr:RDD family protein [Candidatus Vicinibacter affinis]MBK7305425.1 RDD family protein [Candidatus Vicinibacter affinis]MBK9962912.1 RDD family protein [Candidatus Vicinibacter affinis]